MDEILMKKFGFGIGISSICAEIVTLRREIFGYGIHRCDGKVDAVR